MNLVIDKWRRSNSVYKQQKSRHEPECIRTYVSLILIILIYGNNMAAILISKRSDRIKWHFPPTWGGIAQGFHESGKEFFKANVLEHVVREIIQNSLDAKNKKYPDRPVIVKMEKISLKSSMINNTDLTKHVEKSLKRTTEQKNQKGIKFYKNTLKILKKSNIPTLKIVDSNTTGLNSMKWDALVHQEGTPSKDTATAGGSYGIGKNAPYAASSLSLICYSTRYLEKHRTEKFIARCKLVAHENPEKPNEELQHVGFGTSKSFDGTRYQPILGNKIHETFRLKNSGSGIFIVGFTESDWQATAKRSIARNFFAAIHAKRLSVLVEDTNITNETLNGEDFGSNGHKHYYNLYKNSDEPILISGRFGKFYLKISVGDESMENRVAYINTCGMLITDERPFKKNPFSAKLGEVGKYTTVVWAADDKTDVRVRDMEPPTHETIEYERITEYNERQKTKDELREINDLICEHIKEKLNIDKFDQRTDLTELAHIIPFVSDPSHNDTKNHEDTNETNRKLSERISYTNILPSDNSITSITNKDSTEEIGDKKSNKTLDGKNNPNRGQTEQERRNTANMENARIVRHDNMLRVAFTPKTNANKFAILPVGEEHRAEEIIPITKVENASGNNTSVKLDNNIITINTTKNKRVVLNVSLGRDLQYTGYNIEEYVTQRRKK